MFYESVEMISEQTFRI